MAADLAKQKRKPVRVGDVVIEIDGAVLPAESVDPENIRDLRRQLREMNHVQPDIRIPAPYVAEKFVDSTFATYRPDPAAPAQQEALDATREFCQLVENKKAPLLALIGTTGTGKSHLLYSAAKSLHEGGRRVFSRPWYLLADQLRYGGSALFGPHRLEPHELRDALMKESILMIDEVRHTAGTAFDDTELAKIVCHAWDNGRAMLITTNVSPLAEVLGPAVASRFTQVVITGPDHRQS